VSEEVAARVGAESALAERRAPRRPLAAVDSLPHTSDDTEKPADSGSDDAAGTPETLEAKTPQPESAPEPTAPSTPEPAAVAEPAPIATTPDDVAAKVRPGTGSEGLSSPVRVFSRIARLGTARNSTQPLLEPLLRTVRSAHPKADVTVIERAFEVANRAHAGQRRKSGDPYITHPVAVAAILAELGMTPPTLAAALLHDTVEDTAYSLESLRGEVGEEIAMLVDGVTKLDKVKYGDAAQAETVRKMVVAMSKDIRVLVIKLADRLHNARTWRYVPAHKAEKKAKETLEIYAPLAHRLGMK